MFLTSTREIDWLTALFFYVALDVAWATSPIMSLQDLALSLQMAQQGRPDYLLVHLSKFGFHLLLRRNLAYWTQTFSLSFCRLLLLRFTISTHHPMFSIPNTVARRSGFWGDHKPRPDAHVEAVSDRFILERSLKFSTIEIRKTTPGGLTAGEWLDGVRDVRMAFT